MEQSSPPIIAKDLPREIQVGINRIDSLGVNKSTATTRIPRPPDYFAVWSCN